MGYDRLCVNNNFCKHIIRFDKMTQPKPTLNIHKDNHTIGIELESYVDILLYRGFCKEAKMLDEIASHLK